MPIQPRTRLRRLLDALDSATDVIVVPHNNPDPDAIASAVALKYLIEQKTNATVQVVYRGIVGRAENRALTRYLEHPLQSLKMTELNSASHVILIDTQPSFGNNPVLPDNRIAAVLDHHQLVTDEIEADYVDVRPEMGSASSMLVEYLRAAKITIPSVLATALFYGIKTDTMALQRGASEGDQKAFCHLLQFVDFEALGRIERAQISVEYFGILVDALQSTLVYDRVIVSHITTMNYPDLTADIADMLSRARGYRWVFCSGIYKETIYFSIRTVNKRGAGEVARKIVGDLGTAGGHGSMAGGQFPLEGSDPEASLEQLRQNFLNHFSISPEQKGEPFLQEVDE